MNSGEQLIHRFYTAFAARDPEGMIACYHPDVVFTDPVFGRLNAAEARAMWRLLVSRSSDLTLVYSDVKATDDTGSAHWEATYTFSRTGRHVVNKLDSVFAFRDGAIIRQTDTFDFWKWSRQALGPAGVALGWNSILQSRVSRGARASLTAAMNAKP